jgi:hypothetical protein
MSEPSRICCRCNEVRLLSDFTKGGMRADGTQAWCKPCCRAYKRARYAANRSKEVARVIESTKRHRDQHNARQRAYNARNSTAIAARTKRIRAENPERFSVYDHNHMVLRRRGGRGAGITPGQWVAMVAKYKGRCHHCGCKPKKLTKDHLVPLSRGGIHDASNIVPSCATCNARKHALLPHEWARRLGRLL